MAKMPKYEIKLKDTEFIKELMSDFNILAKSVIDEANTSMTKNIAYDMVQKYIDRGE
mgnify:CR=1 FL=1